MGVFWKLIGASVVAAAAVYFSGCCSQKEGVVPPERDGWFGRGPAQKDEDTSIRPFEVKVSERTLKDLHRRLNHSRLGEDLEDTQFQYGFQVKAMREVLDHWKTKYNWREQEKIVNQFPQFKTTIEGLDIHFIHVKPATEKAGRKRVLLMTHGWPGSVWEFHKIIPMLTDPAAFGGREEDAFEMICPSIPGYGFSEAPHQKGFTAKATARIFRKLMLRLGHDKFYVQGGDWGSLVSTVLGLLYPQHVQGVHINMYLSRTTTFPNLVKMVVGNHHPSLVGLSQDDYDKFFPLKKTFIRLLKVTGYFHEQSTKPDTIAFGLNDSPVGLAAYILEKFSEWTNYEQNENLPDGGLREKFTFDELLTNVMIYWITGTIGPSMRYYKENMGAPELVDLESLSVKVPVGMADFPQELFRTPEMFTKTRFPHLLRYKTLPRGGHFAALEEPRLLADEIFAFVDAVENLPSN